MDETILKQISFSILTILIVFLFYIITKSQAKRIQERKQLAQSRYYTIKRVISITSFLLILGILILIWGIDIKNLWLSFTSILAMIAVAFFAVWSLIGNMLAGVIIFFTSPFKINDTIEILPDGVKGKVLAVNTFFTLLLDADENLINIPNSMLFQKYLKKIRSTPNEAPFEDEYS